MTPIRVTVALLFALLPACGGSSPAAADAQANDAVDGAPQLCTDNGNTYALGATIHRSSCTTCVCLAGGVVGHCTGACAPDAGDAGRTEDAGVTCTDNGNVYPVGATISHGGCTTCLCLPEGVVGHCTGACP